VRIVATEIMLHAYDTLYSLTPEILTQLEADLCGEHRASERRFTIKREHMRRLP
jgi:hypothetical protein